jgi:hypothetical protein
LERYTGARDDCFQQHLARAGGLSIAPGRGMQSGHRLAWLIGCGSMRADPARQRFAQLALGGERNDAGGGLVTVELLERLLTGAELISGHDGTVVRLCIERLCVLSLRLVLTTVRSLPAESERPTSESYQT